MHLINVLIVTDGVVPHLRFAVGPFAIIHFTKSLSQKARFKHSQAQYKILRFKTLEHFKKILLINQKKNLNGQANSNIF